MEYLILGLLLYVCAYFHFKWDYKLFAWLSLLFGTLDIIRGVLTLGIIRGLLKLGGM